MAYMNYSAAPDNGMHSTADEDDVQRPRRFYRREREA
jgi:hypothetical protein